MNTPITSAPMHMNSIPGVYTPVGSMLRCAFEKATVEFPLKNQLFKLMPPCLYASWRITHEEPAAPIMVSTGNVRKPRKDTGGVSIVHHGGERREAEVRKQEAASPRRLRGAGDN